MENCFLMEDAGISLREDFKINFDKQKIYKTIEQFQNLQQKIEKNIEVLLKIKTPDWRLSQWNQLCHEMIIKKEMFLNDGVSTEEFDNLKKMIPYIIELCNQLISKKIPETIVQPDFNDNNTLINVETNVITMIDLGELSISHPFFSLFNYLKQMEIYYSEKITSNELEDIKKYTFDSYLKYMDKKSLNETIIIANKLWNVYGIFAHIRLIEACGEKNMKNFQGKLKQYVKNLTNIE